MSVLLILMFINFFIIGVIFGLFSASRVVNKIWERKFRKYK